MLGLGKERGPCYEDPRRYEGVWVVASCSHSSFLFRVRPQPALMRAAERVVESFVHINSVDYAQLATLAYLVS